MSKQSRQQGVLVERVIPFVRKGANAIFYAAVIFFNYNLSAPLRIPLYPKMVL